MKFWLKEDQTTRIKLLRPDCRQCDGGKKMPKDDVIGSNSWWRMTLQAEGMWSSRQSGKR